MHDDRQYLQYFTLTARPFYDLKDPRFVWLGEKQLETLARLKNGIEQRKGIALLTGDEGTGKSVLVDRFLRALPRDSVAVVLREPGLQPQRLQELMVEQLRLPQAETRGEFLNAMKAYLEKVYRGGKYVVVVAEDLDTADDEVIEQIRLLSNLETPDDESLVSILITGNRRLEERLSTYEHRALQQRVEVRRTAEPFTVAETAAYIRHRLMVAGAFLEIFTAEAVERIHRFSGGIPKLIDIICDHALKRACIEKKRKIDGAMIAGYVKEILATSQIGFNQAAAEGAFEIQTDGPPRADGGFHYLNCAEPVPLPERPGDLSARPAARLQLAVRISLGRNIRRRLWETGCRSRILDCEPQESGSRHELHPRVRDRRRTPSTWHPRA